MVHDRLHVSSRLFVDAQLPVGAGAVDENLFDRRDLLLAAKLGDLLAYKLEQLAHEVAGGQLGLLAKVDQLAVEPVAGRAPLVLVDQLFGIDAEGYVALAQLPVPEDERLAEGGDGDGLVYARADVATRNSSVG